jgi:hypothetical protein
MARVQRAHGEDRAHLAAQGSARPPEFGDRLDDAHGG